MFKIGIIGRPNVGKSTLFNRIAGKRIAIVDDMPGVTRDRLETKAEWQGKYFQIIDTAGYDLKEDLVKKEMQQQFFKSLDLADMFLLIVDGLEGLHPLDEIVCDILRQKGKPFILVVNKIDSEQKEILANEFYSLGIDEIFCISATHSRNVDELLDKIIEFIPDESEITEDEDRIKIVVIGKPNVGKSSIINKWLNEERLIVTSIPGTTRDSVDTEFEYKGVKYNLIDTAGIRKKSVMFKDKVEKYGYYRSFDAMAKADIAVGMLDATQGITERDVKVIAEAYEQGRPVVLVFNKWDLVEKNSKVSNEFKRNIEEKFKFLDHPPFIFASAVTGKNIYKIFDAVNELYKEYSKRIPTSELNDLLQYALERHQAPTIRNTRLKMYYMTQIGTKPPEFIIFVNDSNAVHFSYKRYIINLLREYYGFKGIPIFLKFKDKKSKESDETYL
jgi:GTP-binding protein